MESDSVVKSNNKTKEKNREKCIVKTHYYLERKKYSVYRRSKFFFISFWEHLEDFDSLEDALEHIILRNPDLYNFSKN